MKYRLSDLIDVQKIQHLMDILHQIMGPSWAMLDPDGTILARSPWSELCAAFHRANPKTEMRCKDSDAYIKQHTCSGQRIISYTCANGLQDIATPIVIRGEFLGAIYVGQFFYEEPDVDFFRKQAREFGFDESAYLKALKAVPVIPRERVEPIVHFFLQFAESIIDMGIKQFHLVEAREALRESETHRRELVEEALRKSEERFRFLVRQVKDYSIIYLDTEGRIVSWNEGAERIFGYREEEVVGKHYAMLHTEEEIERGDPSRVLEIAAAEGQFKAEGWRVRKDRSRFWTDVVITALRDEFGSLKGFARVGQDITERRNAEEAMNYRLSVEELVVTISKRFINLAPEQMDNEISRTLDAVRDFSGADRCYLSLLSEDGTTITHVFESCSEGIKSRHKELQRISPESLPWAVRKFRRGETIYISDIDDLPPEAAAEKELWTKSSVGAMAAIPVVSGKTLYGYFALNSQRKGREWMTQDMGLLSLVGEIFASTLERIRAEKERRKLEAEILEGQRREMETRQRENEKWIALGQMASGIAHDIRNPINYVSLALDHISGRKQTTRAKGDKTQRLIENAHSELMRVSEMIQGLLEYGRTQSLLVRLSVRGQEK